MNTIRGLAGTVAPAARGAQAARKLAFHLLALAFAACGDSMDESPTVPGAIGADTPTAVAPPPGTAGGAGGSALAAGAIRGLKAYAFIDNPRVSNFLTNDATYNESGSRVEFFRSDRGFYTVTFNALTGVLNGSPHIQVTPVRNYAAGTGRDNCIQYTDAAGPDVKVGLWCQRGSTGVDMKAAVQVFDHDEPVAFVTVKYDGKVENPRFFSRLEKRGTGRYRVFFKRDPLFLFTKAIAFVTAGGADPAVKCQLFSIGTTTTELNVEVDCYNYKGQLSDGVPFNVVAMSTLPRSAFALVWDNVQPLPSHSYNPGGAISVHRMGVGSYQVSFDGLQNLWSDKGTVMVSSHGTSGESCEVDGWGKMPDQNKVRVDVVCRAFTGEPKDTRFAVLATTKF